jgi:hypothetical protein
VDKFFGVSGLQFPYLGSKETMVRNSEREVVGHCAEHPSLHGFGVMGRKVTLADSMVPLVSSHISRGVERADFRSNVTKVLRGHSSGGHHFPENSF